MWIFVFQKVAEVFFWNISWSINLLFLKGEFPFGWIAWVSRPESGLSYLYLEMSYSYLNDLQLNINEIGIFILFSSLFLVVVNNFWYFFHILTQVRFSIDYNKIYYTRYLDTKEM